MPSFTHPWSLLLVLGVPLLALAWLKRRRGVLRFSDTRLVAGLPAGRSRFVLWAGTLLRGLALVLLVVALAGPRWPDRNTRLSTEGIAIELVVDVSGSMAEADFDWQNTTITRLEAVKKALHAFVEGNDPLDDPRLEGRPGDAIGYLVFVDQPESRCPLTLSHATLLHLLDAEQPRAEATNIGDALALGLDKLDQAAPSRKVLVLFTDGYHNVPDPKALKPRQAAQLAAALEIPIYVVDAGRESDREGESADDRARASQILQEVARMTGGQYFPAGDTPALFHACQRIDRLEREKIPSYRYRRYYEGYPWFGLAGLAVLASLQLLELTRWRRTP